MSGSETPREDSGVPNHTPESQKPAHGWKWTGAGDTPHRMELQVLQTFRLQILGEPDVHQPDRIREALAEAEENLNDLLGALGYRIRIQEVR